MASNESQERSTQEQKTEFTLKRRAARQKRVQRIVQILGFPSSGVAIAAKFISELYNSVLDKIEEKLEDKTEPLANSIVNSLENLHWFQDRLRKHCEL